MPLRKVIVFLVIGLAVFSSLSARKKPFVTIFHTHYGETGSKLGKTSKTYRSEQVVDFSVYFIRPRLRNPHTEHITGVKTGLVNLLFPNDTIHNFMLFGGRDSNRRITDTGHYLLVGCAVQPFYKSFQYPVHINSLDSVYFFEIQLGNIEVNRTYEVTSTEKLTRKEKQVIQNKLDHDFEKSLDLADPFGCKIPPNERFYLNKTQCGFWQGKNCVLREVIL